jgi:hypothetical protein
MAQAVSFSCEASSIVPASLHSVKGLRCARHFSCAYLYVQVLIVFYLHVYAQVLAADTLPLAGWQNSLAGHYCMGSTSWSPGAIR